MSFIKVRRKRRRSPIVSAVAGLALGSVLAYCLRAGRKDTPEKRLRRSQMKQRLERPSRDEEILPLKEIVPLQDPMDDNLLLELIRSELRRSCSYPGAIAVSCDRGMVRLEGPVLKSELGRVLRCVARIPGVEEIHDHLEAHRHPWDFGSELSLNGATDAPGYFKVSR